MSEERSKMEFAPDSIKVFNPHEKAPESVKACLVIDKGEFSEWMDAQSEQRIRLDVRVSAKSGKLYLSVNRFVPRTEQGDDEAF